MMRKPRFRVLALFTKPLIDVFMGNFVPLLEESSLAVLILRFILSEETKPKVDDATWEALAELRSHSVFSAPGGNPYHVAAALGSVHEVALLGPYLPREVAEGLPEHVHHIVLENAEPQVIPIREAWRQRDPLRTSMVFELEPGFTIGGWELKRADRLILRNFHYVGEKTWDSALYRARDGSIFPLEVKENNEWPWLPAFVTAQVEGDELVLRAFPDEAVVKLKERFDLVILSGLGPETPLPAPVREDLLTHLQILGDLPVVYEVSGTLSRPEALKDWKDWGVFKVIKASGLNEAELCSWAAALGLKQRHKGLLGLAELAVGLAEALDLDSVVLHRPYLDLYILRDPDDQALEALREAGSFADTVCASYALRARGRSIAELETSPEGLEERSELEESLTPSQRRCLKNKGFFRVGRFGVVPHPNCSLPPGAILTGQGDVKTAAVQSFFHSSLEEVRSAWTRPAMASGSRRERG